MKKNYVILLFSLAFGFSAMAQTVEPMNNLDANLDGQSVNYKAPHFAQNAKSKATETGWLNPSTLWQDQGASWTGATFMRLWPDSNVVLVPSDGSAPFRQSWHLLGSTIQPEEPFYELQTGWLMNRYDNYQVDSLAMTYAYIRLADSMMVGGSMAEIVDTAVIHFYTASNFTRWFMNNTDDHFLIPNNDNFSVEQLGPNDVLFTDTLLLTRAAATDTAQMDQLSIGFIQLEVPTAIGAISDNPAAAFDNVAGMSLVYKPMQPYVAGDTLVSFNESISGSKTFNQFGGVSFFNDGLAITQPEYHNNAFVSNFQVRYGQEFGPIRGYLPSVAFFGWNSDFFMDHYYHVTVEDPSSVANIEDELGATAYPNPAAMGQEILVSVENAVSENTINIELVNILGNAITAEFSPVGNKTYSLKTEGLAGGVYFINITADNAASTLRIVVAD